MSERRGTDPGEREPVLTLSQIRGQDGAVALLRQALSRRTLHHALLFVGPEGVGKRTTAIALAARLLCREGTEEACGRCAACAQVAARSHADFRSVGFFFDEKKKELRDHTLIEQVREVQLFLAGQALGGGRKVVRSEEHTSELQSQSNLVCRLLLEKK